MTVDMAHAVSYWTVGDYLYRLTPTDEGALTEAYDPRTDSWVDDPGEFMWRLDARVLRPEQLQEAKQQAQPPEPEPDPPQREPPVKDRPTGLTGSQIVARGETLDIPWETPEPGELQYGDDHAAEDNTGGYDFERIMAWANNFLHGTPMPEEPEDGTDQVPVVPGGTPPEQGGKPRVPKGGALGWRKPGTPPQR